MSGDIVIKNPWGRGKVSLKGRVLSINEKSYLAQLVNHDGKTCDFVGKTYSLSKSVIAKYAKSARDGLILHTGAGHLLQLIIYLQMQLSISFQKIM